MIMLISRPPTETHGSIVLMFATQFPDIHKYQAWMDDYNWDKQDNREYKEAVRLE